jgi:tRNA (mo5U34)-methyltransferase
MQTQSPEAVWSEEALQQKIEELGPWFHNLRLGGLATAPHHFLGDYPEVKWARFRDALPADMRGMTVLDIGCNAGFYSFAMKQRGADLVIGIDWDETYLQQAQFAAGILKLDVTFRRMSVWRVAELRQKFDLVIFMGVLYHLRHPLLALDLIHEHVARDLLLFQSMQRGSDIISPVEDDYPFSEQAIFEEVGYPRMQFVEHCYTGDPTNWWVPNRACVEAMLRSSGFAIASHPEPEVYLCRWQSASADARPPFPV